MSHQTGIEANDELRRFFAKCKDGRIRAMKVGIDTEQLVLLEHLEPSGTWKHDFDRTVLHLVEDQQPCYIFYRLDTKNGSSYDWVFISWSPDTSPVRQKMLYASTKATLKKEFGGGHIQHELFGTARDDVSLHGFEKFLRAGKDPGPLTRAEEELQSIKRDEAGTAISVDSKQQTVQGVAFPISDDAVGALFDMKEKLVNYVQLSIDLKKEEINLEHKDNISVKLLSRHIPKNQGRYHLFCFSHSYEGDYIHSNVFIYSMPSSSCSIKERMLYSSCKNPFLETVEQKIGIEVAKRIEVDDPAELTEAFLLDEIHPKKNVYRQKFAKPKGPSNRGAPRLIKSQPNQGP